MDPYLLESGEEGITISSSDYDDYDVGIKTIFIKQFLLPKSLDRADLEKFLNRILKLNIYS